VVPDVSLPEFLLATAAKAPEATAIIDAESRRRVRYGELADAVRRVAAGLAACGLRPGQTLAIMAPNSPEWLVASFGAMAAGGVVTGINPLCTPGEVATQLTDSSARFVMTVPPLVPAARDAIARAAHPGHPDGPARLIAAADGTSDAISFSDLLASGDAAARPEPVAAEAIAMLPYSSGTTGLPKGVMLTHRACVANVVQMLTAIPVAPQDVVLAVAPFFHAVGFAVLACRTLLSGATLVTLPRFDVAGFLAAIQDYRVTHTVVVPPIAQALAKHPAVDEYDLSSLNSLGCGAAPLGAQTQEACMARLGCPVGQGYGMTEATAGIALWPLGTPVVPGSCGRLLPGVSARIVVPGTGADAGPGEAGELLITSPALMSGYLSDPDATAATIHSDDDGTAWLHTGDIARFNDDGELFIIDRLKELIKVKAFQVAPAELEAVLRAHPSVADAAVIRVPDERTGEAPKAFVVPAAGVAADEATARELIDYVAGHVAPYKRIREIAFIEAIPATPSGKVLRRVLTAAGT
jgi:acyl-CoA synthetase (AMP-forming)/AMP-acid ligase II